MSTMKIRGFLFICVVLLGLGIASPLVSAEPPATLLASAERVPSGGYVTLSGTFQGKAGFLDHGLGEVSSPFTLTVGPIYQHTTYSLTVDGGVVATRKIECVWGVNGAFFALTAPATVLHIQSGGMASASVSVLRVGGFANPVHLAIGDLPPGISIKYDPNPVPARGQYVSTLTFEADSNAVSGGCTITLNGTSTGQPDQSLKFTLYVDRPTSAASPTTTGTTVATTQTSTGSPEPQPAVILRALNGSVPSGGTATLIGSFSNGSGSIDHGVGPVTSPFAIAVGPITSTTTYTLTVGTAPYFVHANATVSCDWGITGAFYTLSAATTILSNVSPSTTVSVLRVNNFANPVTLSLDNPPAGISATFTPATIPGTGSNTSSITINSSGLAANHAYTVTLLATSTGQPDQRVLLTFYNGSPASDFRLSPSPQLVVIPAGGSGNSTIGIARNNYTGPVYFESEVRGLTVGYAPNLTTTNSATMTITVPSTVPTGAYPIKIHASGPGVPDRYATVVLQVNDGLSLGLRATPSDLGPYPPANTGATLSGAFSGGSGFINNGIGPVTSPFSVPTGPLTVGTIYTLIVTDSVGQTVRASAPILVNGKIGP